MSGEPEASCAPESPTEVVRVRLDELARRYYAPLASFFRKRTRAPEVEDLVQQVFLRLAQYREFDSIQNPDGYIFQSAANTLKDHYRNNAVRERFARESLAALDDAQRSDFSPERVLQGRQAVAQLTRALRRLPERTRDILVLRCFEGLRHAEIARLQGISVRAVEKHVAKALAYLSQALERGAGE